MATALLNQNVPPPGPPKRWEQTAETSPFFSPVHSTVLASLDPSDWPKDSALPTLLDQTPSAPETNPRFDCPPAAQRPLPAIRSLAPGSPIPTAC